jgi:hypothetical protein
VEGCHVPLEALRRLTVVPQVAVDMPQVELRDDREANIPQGSGNRQGALARGEGTVRVACKRKMGEQKGRDPSQPGLIAQGLGKGFGFLQADEDPFPLSQREERSAQVETEIDGLREGITRLRQTPEGTERLLEVLHGLAVGRACHGLLPRLPAVRQGLVPHLPPQGMVGQAFDLLGHPVAGERLQGLDDVGIEYPPPLLQEAPVGHLLGEDMLEGVRVLGKEARLVEEFGSLQVAEASVQGWLGQLGNGPQQGQGYLRADDRGGLEEARLRGRQPIDASGQDAVDGGGDVEVCACFQDIHVLLPGDQLLVV